MIFYDFVAVFMLSSVAAIADLISHAQSYTICSRSVTRNVVTSALKNLPSCNTRWLYWVDYPQYSIRLEEIGDCRVLNAVVTYYRRNASVEFCWQHVALRVRTFAVWYDKIWQDCARTWLVRLRDLVLSCLGRDSAYTGEWRQRSYAVEGGVCNVQGSAELIEIRSCVPLDAEKVIAESFFPSNLLAWYDTIRYDTEYLRLLKSW